MFNSSRVKVGVGTLYVAALASSEPITVTAAWPSTWRPIGYTDTGYHLRTSRPRSWT